MKFLLLALTAIGTGCAATPSLKTSEKEIFNLISEQEAAWNRGDIEAFMASYDRSEELTFAAGGKITKGWLATLEKYKKAYDSPEKMGKLLFSELRVEMFAEDAGFVFGRWTLERETDRPTGYFTLLLRRKPEEWRIVLDHTSSAP